MTPATSHYSKHIVFAETRARDARFACAGRKEHIFDAMLVMFDLITHLHTVPPTFTFGSTSCDYPYVVGLGVNHTGYQLGWGGFFLRFNETIFYIRRTPGLGGCISCPACCVLLV